ncbi:DUF1330 domain-containing protein [Sulfitobacter aestuariivivens]|uniref:DUF1330 domain-containing protein n=1 Tax=Sulfitobacter aestuariivivens TaxID=2766981 RepID=A0A927D9C5_9RHOB|nr:DUF1330 domain-containing protein [Sulfitobacter aestuariivivens]MBD3666032.1 DUF1330 domain-containing protein [Sulfitobacter aestuariivivens]
MPAILTATISIKDMEKMMAYGEKAMPTILAHEGEMLYRAQTVDVLRGAADHTFSTAFRFPDVAAVKGWFNSPEYEALHALRNEAADVTFVVHEEV